ncbi:MAG: ATP-binding protein [Clostridia bacterium]|nr:ATP-binding protein [Clostridia bacterium]
MKQKSSELSLLTKLFFRLLPYHILLIAINAVNGIADSLYASNAIGKSAMSAIGLFAPLNHFLYAASMLFVSGSQILYGRYLSNNRQKIHGLFTVTLVLSGGLGVLMSLLMGLGVMTGATRLMINTEPELAMFNQYLLGQMVGIPALILGQQLFSFLSLENQKTRTMVASILCLISNVVMDHVCIVFLKMGTYGLGLSSAISVWFFFGVQAIYYLRGKSEWKFSLRNCAWEDSPSLFSLGYTGALSRFLEMFRCLIVNGLILMYVGNAGLSSFAASNSIMGVMWSVPFGMMAVSRIFFSISVGEEDRQSIINVFRIVLTRGMLIIAGIVAFLFVMAEPLTRLFYRDPSDPVYTMTVMAFRILPFCMFFSLLSLHFAGYSQVAEKKVMSFVLPVIDGMVGVVLFSFILIPSLKMNGLYFANILNGVLCTVVILTGSIIHRKRFPRTLEDLLDIPDRIGVGEDERIDISVTSTEEVVKISSQVMDFCLRKGIERRRAYFSGLCLEEIAGNVVTHGFVEDNEEHSVDIRVIHKDGILTLRIRDNCKSFDPTSYHKALETDRSGKNVGIQLAFAAAREISYQNLLGMNVLTIRI